MTELTQEQINKLNAERFYIIRRKVEYFDSGVKKVVWEVVAVFAGANSKQASAYYDKLKKIYQFLPEFDDEYFSEHYVMNNQYFDAGLLVDRVPSV